MEIKAQQFTIELTHDELWSMAWDVKHALLETLKTHWVNHQLVWKEHEKNRLNRIEKMFTHLGRYHEYKDIYINAQEIFSKFNELKDNANTKTN